MKNLVSVCSALLLMTGVAAARPLFLLPTQQIQLPAGFHAWDVAISGDWIAVGGPTDADQDPNTNIALNRVYLYQRAANGQWSSGTLLFQEQSDQYFANVALNDQVLVVGVNSGTHVFERTAAGWTERPVDGAAALLSGDYRIDGTTILIGDGHCGANAVTLDRTPAGHWAKSGDLLGTPKPCSDGQVGNLTTALSGNQALVWDAITSAPNHVRVFGRTPGSPWTNTTVLAPPPLDEPEYYFGAELDLSGSLALVAGGNRGTNVYRRSGSTWSRAGFMTFLDGYSQFASRLKIGDRYIVQSSASSTVNVQLLRVFRERADLGFDEVAQLTTSDGTPYLTEFDISGSRVVAATWDKVFFYQLPEPLNPAPATQQYDFETGSTAQWSILPGSSFSVASRGTTHVYRQSSTAGDAAATHPDDRTTQAIQADITPTAVNGTDRWVGLVTRYTDESNYYYATWRSSGWIVLKRMRNGVFTELAKTPVGLTLNQPRRFRLESDGNRHMVFIDDFEYLHAFDDTLPHGRSGLRTYRAAADFDNVLVSAAPRAMFVREEINQTAAAFDPVDGQWAIEYDNFYDQDLYLQHSVAGDARTVAWPASDDQIVQTFLRVDAFAAPAPGKEYWAGLLARYQNPSNYYYVSLRSSNQISLRRVVNGQVTVLRSAPLPVAAGDSYLLRLDVVGQKLRVYVDYAFQFEASDATFASGKTGLVTYKTAASFGAFSAYQP